ncbi:unnamed protein product, partial [marine sediment metagenome]
NYVGTIGRVSKLGTIAYLGTVLLTIHVGTVHKIDRLGTLDEMTRAGTLNRIAGGRVGTLGRLGTVHYVERIGTISNLGSISYIGTVNRIGGGRIGTLARLGSIHYQERLGTVGYQGRLGTISARLFSGIGAGFGLGTHVARGSWYLGSWIDVSRFQTKTLVIHPSSLSGTIHIMTSVLGNATERGTYYSARIGKGSYSTKSFAEALKEAKAVFEASGSSVTGKGTLRSQWGLQV